MQKQPELIKVFIVARDHSDSYLIRLTEILRNKEDIQVCLLTYEDAELLSLDGSKKMRFFLYRFHKKDHKYLYMKLKKAHVEKILCFVMFEEEILRGEEANFTSELENSILDTLSKRKSIRQ